MGPCAGADAHLLLWGIPGHPCCWLHTLDPHPCAQEVSLAVGSSWTLFRRKQEVFAFEERVRPVDNAGQRHRTLSATGRIYNNIGRSKVKGWKSQAMQTLIKKKAGVGLFILDKRLSIKKGTKDKEMLHNDKRIHPPKYITILKVCDRIQSLKIHEPKTDTLNREIETPLTIGLFSIPLLAIDRPLRSQQGYRKLKHNQPISN
uniref:Uncharacterized protein n=1 Tax=Myotis myotis TaxID=51298 RepID=A0A7J7WHN0_MYOMY|nr:hypothetical protein mMyoMyo1_012088 [Myotis myotis]